MVTGDTVQDIACRNFEEVQATLAADRAATTTPAQAKAVEDNYEQAMSAYLQTLIDGFAAKSGNWDQLLADAQNAEAAVNAARQGAQNTAAKIQAMTNLTGAVTKLVNAVA